MPIDSLPEHFLAAQLPLLGALDKHCQALGDPEQGKEGGSDVPWGY